ncbi:MAG: Threonine dehydrogenase and related Zn-dependent dehydrogenases, partial [uncultured Gemmatimonadetes bacterium]
EGTHLARPVRRTLRQRPRSHHRGPHGRDHPHHLHGDLRLGPSPLRRLPAADEARRHPGPRAHGDRGGGGPGSEAPEAWGPRGGPLHHLVRKLLVLPEHPVLALRHLQPQPGAREDHDGPRHGGPVRLLAAHGRLRGGAGAVPPRPLRGRGPHPHRQRPAGRAGALPVGHLPHGVDGRGERGDRTRRHGGGVGVRAGGPVHHPQRVDDGRRPGDRHRPRPRAAAHGRGARQGGDDQLQGGGRLRPADGDDGRPRPRPLHRRGGGRGARHGERGRVVRQGQVHAAAGDGAPARAARGHHVLPQGRHHLHPRRLPGLPGQDPVRRGHEQGAHLQDGPDAHPALPGPPPEAHRSRRDRPLVRHHPRGAHRPRPRDVQDLPGQRRRVHQGGAEALGL